VYSPAFFLLLVFLLTRSRFFPLSFESDSLEMFDSVGVRPAVLSRVDLDDLDLRENRRRCRPGVDTGVSTSEVTFESVGVAVAVEGTEAVEVRRRMN